MLTKIKCNIHGKIYLYSCSIDCSFKKFGKIDEEELCDLLKLDSELLRKLFYLLQLKPFKNDEKCFLFHLKTLFSFSRYLNICFDFLVT